MTEGVVHTQVDGSFFYEMKKGTGPFFIFSETMASVLIVLVVILVAINCIN